MRNLISIEVEIELGASIEEAAIQLCQLASTMQVKLRARFNDVLLLVVPRGDPAALVDNFYKAVTSKTTYKLATNSSSVSSNG